MQREFVSVLAEAKDANIFPVSKPSQVKIIDDLTACVVTTVSEWLSRRMQTQRSGKSEALFDLTPAQTELKALVDSCRGLTTFETVISNVCQWLKAGLTTQISNAKDTFGAEIPARIVGALNTARDRLIADITFRQNDVQRTVGLAATVLLKRADELQGWFRASDGSERPPLTFKELKVAADGVFEYEILRGILQTNLRRCMPMDAELRSDKVRICFDLLSEVFYNALKYRSGEVCIVRIYPFTDGKFVGFVFSNQTSTSADEVYSVVGKLYTSLTDQLFGEGNSGLPKIAALSASLVGEIVSLRVVRRRRVFRIFIPFWALSD
jgi:hypothetical protein